MNPSTFTAAQISLALGSSRQAVQSALASVPEDGKQIVRGNEAGAWRFASLPSPMQQKLNRRAKARGFRNAEHLLADAPRRFESSVPISQLAEAVQQRAMTLRAALARPLADHASGLKGAALEELGLREYERVFTFGISACHWKRLFNRTIARDAGENQWERLDLYVDDRPRSVRRSPSPKTSPAVLDAEKILLGYASQVRDPANPMPEEKAQLWCVAFEQALSLVESGLKLARARKAMRRALWRCGASLAKTEASLAEQWRVKEAAWRDAEGSIKALKDGRAEASGHRRAPEIPKRDIDRVIAFGVKFDGRISQAWRHVLENRMLSPDVQFYYLGG